MLAVATTLWPVVVALAVGVVLAILWWAFDAAPRRSRRERFDRRGRVWAHGQIVKGSGRFTLRTWLLSCVVVVLLLIWIAHG